MQHVITSSKLRLRRLGVAGCAAALFAMGACTDEAIVYPNRNLKAPTAGTTSAEAGEAGTPPSGGTSAGGGGGKSGGGTGGGPISVGGDDISLDDGGSGGAEPLDQCGDGIVQPPEECDDKNRVSGDGCSAQCKTSCEICEQHVCPQYDTDFANSAYDSCYKNKDLIPTGPAHDVSRAVVCQALVDCIRREHCAQVKGGAIKIQACWCAADWDAPGVTVTCGKEPDPANPTDPTKFIPGKCANEYQDAAEVDTKAAVLPTLTASSKANGLAARLLQLCDTRNCTEECVPEYFGHEGIATITSDIVAMPNKAGESPLGDLVADAQRTAAGADFAFVDQLRFLPVGDASPDLLFAPTPFRGADAPGRVLWSEAFQVHAGHGLSAITGKALNQAADTNLYKVTLTGQQIFDALTQQFSSNMLSVSGLTFSYDQSLPIAMRVLEVKKGGTPIDKAANYTVALAGSLSGQVPTEPSPIPALTAGTQSTPIPNLPLNEVLGEYLKQLPQPVSPPALDRVTCMNCN